MQYDKALKFVDCAFTCLGEKRESSQSLKGEKIESHNTLFKEQFRGEAGSLITKALAMYV